ncbi:hypothetical protein MF271_11645 [Deinococcus sp. KNUC1210]|uniref:hypothetical protein n=1 Tax=Deinococcus sp. KNUC1210 TaxID=2917691 RepID=UPI001EF153D2|nr:hypothetical protein [Deinococcus sp. KNUC1210]ULH14659.1 hypothetical protein MF271_11645 [Deinococcus sp. KNUC1210]
MDSGRWKEAGSKAISIVIEAERLVEVSLNTKDRFELKAEKLMDNVATLYKNVPDIDEDALSIAILMAENEKRYDNVLRKYNNIFVYVLTAVILEIILLSLLPSSRYRILNFWYFIAPSLIVILYPIFTYIPSLFIRKKEVLLLLKLLQRKLNIPATKPEISEVSP